MKYPLLSQTNSQLQTMLKAAKKKLKFWSKSKKRKKIHNPYLFPPPPPPPPCHWHCCTCLCSSAIQPSAPPLPPSEHPDDAGGEITAPLVAGPSYQQYMDPNPVYGVPIMEQSGYRRDQRWFTVLWDRLIGCLCPSCIRIPEAYYMPH